MIESDELEQLIPKSHDRCILVKKCKPIRIEAIVRGYISGSAYNQYLESGMISDIEIKENMKLNDKFESQYSHHLQRQLLEIKIKIYHC